MPIYAYRCKKRGCKKLYEYFHHGPEDVKAKCPYCGSVDSEKQVSNTGGHVVNGANAKNRYGLR